MKFGRDRSVETGEEWGADSVSRKVQMGLDALRCEPLEPSVSIEALKGRILQETLVAPRRPAWVWATPVAASLAVAFWLGLAVRPAAPVAEALPKRTASVAPVERHGSLRAASQPAVRAASPPEAGSPAVEAPPRNVDAPSGAVALRGGREGGDPVVVSRSSAMLASGLRPEQDAAPAEQLQTLAAPPEPPAQSQDSEEQIVLIHSTEDTETGAASAVELESSANVLVGG